MRADAIRQAALHDRFLEEAFHRRHSQHIHNGCPARGFPVDRDIFRIAAKSRDIIMDSLHCHNLVGDATVTVKVLASRICGKIIKPQYAHPILERDK